MRYSVMQLTARDRKIVEEVTQHWGDITLPMLRIFGNDITPAHWMYAGYIKGKRSTLSTGVPHLTLN